MTPERDPGFRPRVHILLRVTDIEDLAYWINERARETLLADGTHAGMFFLRTANGVSPQLLGGTTRSEMPEALKAIAEAVEREQADGVVVVAEAWSAPIDDLPEGGAAESLHARDILLVTALDSHGTALALETSLHRLDDEHVELGPTVQTESQSIFLNSVRRLWGLADVG